MATTTVYGTETVAIDEDTTPLILYHYDTDTPNPSDNEIPVFQDVFFAILFWVHLLFMVWLGVEVAPMGYEKIDINWTMIEETIKEGDDVTEEDFTKFEDFLSQATAFLEVYPYRIVVYLVVPCLLISFLLALLATATLIKPFPKPIVYASLIGSVLGTILVLGSFALSTGSLLSILLAGLMLMGVGYYVKIAWRMVPFAAVNLKVALEGIGKNLGVYLVAFLLSQLGFVWNIFWVYILIGVSALKDTECLNDHPEATLDDDTCSPPVLVVAGFLLSLYWTSTVIMNTIQVTVSGVMATWCFVADEAESCCSPAVTGSLVRSMTYSFGSICFGSLLQALIATFRFLLESARNSRNSADDNACGSILLCCLECLARCVEDILEYFNQWAYVFVGIYGTSYLESGRKVIELFRARGWTAIVSDKLVGYTLGFVVFGLAVATGVIGVVVESMVSQSLEAPAKSYLFGELPGPSWFAFGLSFVVGLWVSSVMMNVVRGAVNALIVCWADSPAKLEMQHPSLTAEMATAWRSVFPDVILRL